MINVKIEENRKNNYVLKVGDVLISSYNELCFVIECSDHGTGSSIYAIKHVMSARTLNVSKATLEELTNHARAHGYIIYPQDQYDLILRHKDIGAVG